MEQQLTKRHRIEWIDAAKFFAILAVMTDHSYKTLYTDRRIAFLSYFSVSLFILLMGLTCSLSYQSDPVNIAKKVRKQCKGLLIPYIAATFICTAAERHFFDFSVFWEHLIRFNAAAPFYYVILYLQLLLVTPLIYRWFSLTDKKKPAILMETAGLLPVLLICFLTTNYSNILNIYGGGGKLLGGNYLLLLYLGMWFGKYYHSLSPKPAVKWAGFVLSLAAAAGWGLFLCRDQFRLDSHLPFGAGMNPPGISLCTHAALIFAAFYFLGEILKDHGTGFPARVFRVMSLFGRHTLYIFLYHKLIQQQVRLFSKSTGIRIHNLGLRAVFYFALMIGLSLLLEILMKKLFSFVKRSYR